MLGAPIRPPPLRAAAPLRGGEVAAGVALSLSSACIWHSLKRRWSARMRSRTSWFKYRPVGAVSVLGKETRSPSRRLGTTPNRAGFLGAFCRDRRSRCVSQPALERGRTAEGVPRGVSPGALSRADSLEETARPLPGDESPAQEPGAEARMPSPAAAQGRSVALLEAAARFCQPPAQRRPPRRSQAACSPALASSSSPRPKETGSSSARLPPPASRP